MVIVDFLVVVLVLDGVKVLEVWDVVGFWVVVDNLDELVVVDSTISGRSRMN